MAGYTDRIFRSICLSHGASLAYTEMVSSEGVARESENTTSLMTRGTNEKNLAVQIFMANSNTALRGLDGVLAFNPALIDINCGCPVPKVIKTGAGSYLLQNPKVIKEIVYSLKTELRNRGLNIPVTIKIRTGWDISSINYLQTAELAFDAGIDAIALHGRTRSQLYMPLAHWEFIKDLKNHFPEKIIIGSGDLFTANDGKKMLEETGCDGIMFARGAIGNPFVFEQTKALLLNQPIREVSLEEKKEAIMYHLKGLEGFLGENTACREMRKHVCAYLKGIPGSSKAKQAISSAITIKAYEEALQLLCY
ncbi:MAG: tRNA dihydrouridine synthase DusB [Sphaerochaetaceae bacterium]|nr:tRNA dihydrouridine synthase DusB [Sphaerochaetaceae bacterium]